jgi:hypothetical protein
MHPTPKSSLSDFPEPFSFFVLWKRQRSKCQESGRLRGLWNQKKLTQLTLCGRTEEERKRERERGTQAPTDCQTRRRTDWLTDCCLLLLHYGGALPLPLPCFADHIHSQARRLSSSWAGSEGHGSIAQIGRRSQIRQPRCFFFFVLKVSLTYPYTT